MASLGGELDLQGVDDDNQALKKILYNGLYTHEGLICAGPVPEALRNEARICTAADFGLSPSVQDLSPEMSMMRAMFNEFSLRLERVEREVLRAPLDKKSKAKILSAIKPPQS